MPKAGGFAASFECEIANSASQAAVPCILRIEETVFVRRGVLARSKGEPKSILGDPHILTHPHMFLSGPEVPIFRIGQRLSPRGIGAWDSGRKFRLTVWLSGTMRIFVQRGAQPFEV